MSEGKKFYIPRNFETRFELFKGVGLKEVGVMIPILYVTTVMDIYTPFSLAFKIIASSFMVVLPAAMLIIPAKRSNLKLYQYIVWRVKYLKRDKTYIYKKEGINK